MRASGGARIEWADLPDHVRRSIEDAVGGTVVEATSQSGGFSPGVAARCTLESGRRIFVKAVSPDQNGQAPRIHRREVEVASQLPDWMPAPRLIHVHDDGHWVALAFEDVDGRQPHEPWTYDDLDAVMPATAEMARLATPAPVDSLASVVDKHGHIFDGFRRLASGDGRLDDVPAWVRDRIDDLAAVEDGWADAARGDTLVHADLRADNILLRPDGGVVFVDWPWACRGAAFVDHAKMLPSLGLDGGPDVATVIDRYRILESVDERRFLAVFTAVCGFFLRASLDDAPRGLPALPAFQRAQADVGLAWLRTALDQR